LKEKFEANFDIFRVDSDDGVTLRDGRQVNLQPKELMLLCLLLQHANNTVTKAEMIDQVWAGQEVSDASIMRCVSSLKRRLKDVIGDSVDFIQSEYGRGYRFVGVIDHSKSFITDEAFYAVIDASPDFIAMKDGQGRWLAANHAGLVMYDLIGRTWQGLTDKQIGQMLPQFAQNLHECVISDEEAWSAKVTTNSVERLVADGVERVFYVAKSPLFNSDGSRKMLVVFGRDVTALLASGI